MEESRAEPTRARGPCSDCEHVRKGTSIARVAFDATVASFQPKLRQTQTQKLQEESQQGVAASIAERESQRQQSLRLWSRRPTVPEMPYCGVAEFEGRYGSCEVMNLDEACDQFTPRMKVPQPRSCRTCEHDRRTSARVFYILEQTVERGGAGRGLMNQQIRPWFDAQAVAEYQDCVDYVGVLRTQPILLPFCSVRSGPDPDTGEPRYLVGPVVNAGARCDRWSPRSQTESSNDDPQLEVLYARYLQADAALNRETSLNPYLQLQKDVAAAAAEVVQRCLTILGADPSQADSILSAYVRDVWGEESAWTTPRDAAAQASLTAPPPVGEIRPDGAGMHPPPADAATSEASAAVGGPFALLPYMTYAHPQHPELHLSIVINPGQALAVVQFGAASSTYQPPSLAYDLAALTPNEWTRLETDDGPLPIAIGPQLPTTVSAMWL